MSPPVAQTVVKGKVCTNEKLQVASFLIFAVTILNILDIISEPMLVTSCKVPTTGGSLGASPPNITSSLIPQRYLYGVPLYARFTVVGRDIKSPSVLGPWQ